MSYWRIRMMYNPTGEDFTERAWQENLVGIWFGAWNAADLKAVDGLNLTDAAVQLSKLPKQRVLGWKIKPSHVRCARKFRDQIGMNDWVFVYFNQGVHLGRVAAPGLLRRGFRQFDQAGDIFKARTVFETKSFRLAELPEPFRLLTSAGRSTLHQVPSTESLITILAESQTPAHVRRKISQLDWEEWLNALGPKGWESLCLGYLVLEKGYIPTGLGMGETLPDFDHVGRRMDGTSVLAQCKKSNRLYRLNSRERAAFTHSDKADKYLFAYGGAENVPSDVRVITEQDFRAWLGRSPAGVKYRKLLMGF